MNKQLPQSISNAATDVMTKIGMMSSTYDAVVAENNALKQEIEELKQEKGKMKNKGS